MSSLGIFDKETKTYKKVADLSKTAVIDSSMSDTSTNAVQNKVVKKYVDDHTVVVDSAMSDTSTNPVQNKVVKSYVDGRTSSVAWNNITGKPSTYTPSSHTHTKSQITDFPSSLPANGGNSDTVNGHTVNSDVPSGAKFTDTTYGDATTSAHGLMTPAMVSKLNGIAAGANKTTVDSEMSSTSTNPVQNKVVKSYVDGRTILDTSMSDTSTNAVQNNVVKNYVDTHTTLDTVMSDSSTKAVQNKVVKSYVDGKFKQKLLAQMAGDGKTSYCQLCTIKINGPWVDTPIEITVQERGRGTLDRLTVLFNSVDNNDPNLISFKVFGEFGDWYISKRAASTWVIYGTKNESWGHVRVVDYSGIDGVNVTWDVTGVTALPDSKTKASWGGNVNHANSADSASSVAWNNITGKPSTYTPSSHTHTKSQITDFPSSLPANGGNSDTVNGHTVNSDVPSGAKFTDTTYNDATTSTHGLMTPAMVTKLNGIADGANRTTVDTSMSATSANPVQNKIVKSYIDNGLNTLKKSVSDGKTKVANAITDKGVDTATDATFDVMAENIRKIETGGGELHGATLAVSTEENTLFGQTVTLTLDGASVATTVFADNGTCSFVVQNPGTYTITCGEADKEVTVTGDNVVNKTVISVELSLLKIVAFATGTDEEIAAMIEAHYNDKINISDYWAVGDMRTVHLSAMAATGVGESHRAQDVQFVIGDFNHDDLATPINGHSKAVVTLLQKDCLMDASNASNPVNGSGNTENGYMNSTGTNIGGWKSCARRTWCNNVFFAALPSAWQSMVKTVNKKVSVGNCKSTIETVQDKIFLAAEIETFGSITYSFAGEGTQYQYYKNATANIYKMPRWSSVSYAVSHTYWERSPNKSVNSKFCGSNYAGNASTTESGYPLGVATCLCI